MGFYLSEQSKQKATLNIFFCFNATGKFNIELSEVFLGSPCLAAEKAAFPGAE